MNDEDLRDLFAAFALTSKAWMSGKEERDAIRCYEIADAMIEAKHVDENKGIAAVMKRTRKKDV